MPENVLPPSSHSSLVLDSSLYNMALSLDIATIQRSSIVQEERVARAQLDARALDRYPQVRPMGSIEFDDGPQASVGPYVEQVIFDAGRSRASLGDAEIGVAISSLRAWAARNAGVYEGLRAYVDMSRYQSRLRVHSDLEEQLFNLRDLLEVRANGGVADRGELLRMNVALQELSREIVADTASLSQARSDLVRYLPGSHDMEPLDDLAGVASQCDRTWPQSETPDDALARVEVDRALNSENYTNAQRFPRLVVGAGAAITSLASAVTPGLSLNIDANDMLGMSGRARIEAAELASQAAIVAYQTQRINTEAELARLEANYVEYQTGLQQLRGLQNVNRETLTLYGEQIRAGSIPLTEGIALYREVSRTQNDIIDLHADALLNCLASSELRGLLVPFSVSNAVRDE